jgi:hypothetical protein
MTRRIALTNLFTVIADQLEIVLEAIKALAAIGLRNRQPPTYRLLGQLAPLSRTPMQTPIYSRTPTEWHRERARSRRAYRVGALTER